MKKYLLILLSSNIFANCEIPENILQEIDNIRYPSVSFQASLQVVDKNLATNKETILTMQAFAKNGSSFVIYESPKKQQGQTILNVDKNIYMFSPKTSNPIKISAAQKIIGQASIADILSLQYQDNYQIESFENNDEHILLKLKAYEKSAAYQKIDLTINCDFQPQEAQFLTQNDKLLKTMFFEDYQNLAGQNRPSKMTIKNAINENEITEVIYQDMQLKEINDNAFNKDKIKDLADEYL